MNTGPVNLVPYSHEWFRSPDGQRELGTWKQYFISQDPKLKSNPSLGIVLYHQPDGTIVPAGITFLDKSNRFNFWYHQNFVRDGSLPPIAYTLPKRTEIYTTESINPFFDNLGAEGWLGVAQAVSTGQVPGAAMDTGVVNEPTLFEQFNDTYARYHRLMMFGRDCQGAVSVTYMHPDPEIEQMHSELIANALRSRGTIGGMQPKFLGFFDKTEHRVRAARYGETSTDIIKLAGNQKGIVEAEYMSLIATKALLPHDPVAKATIIDLPSGGMSQPALCIKRFDRKGNKRVHFEEIAQLMGKISVDRYDASYDDIAKLLDNFGGKRLVKQFYARLVSQFMLGNGDSHLKNFAMYQDDSAQWQLTPNYDLAPSIDFCKRSDAPLALRFEPMKSGQTFVYKNLNAKKIVEMGMNFGLSLDEVRDSVGQLRSHIEDAKQAVLADDNPHLTKADKDTFCKKLDGRSHNLFGTFDRYCDIAESKAQRRR